jgi:CRISPR-associated exonuclease Cas4
MRRKQKLPTFDIAESFVSVTDVKHYIYCPRIVYFERVLHAKPIFGSQQEEGREKHEEYVRKELRRKDAIYYSQDFIGATKILFVNLNSPELELTGQLDCIIKTVNGEYVPVDYKSMSSNKGKVWMDHKYQLVAYGLLVEENYSTVVKRGFINYIPEKLVLNIEITSTMKTHVRRVIGHIKRIKMKETLPSIRVTRHKCLGGCGYKHLC